MSSDDVQLAAGPARQRCVLAVLLMTPHSVVSVDVLVDRVWGATPPARARNVLATYLSRLRSVLHTGAPEVVLRYRDGGYLIDCDDDLVDVHRARKLAARARMLSAQGDDEEASRLLDEALVVCSGVPLAGLTGEWVERARERLLTERLVLVGEHMRLRLRLGEHEQAVTELNDLVAEHPLHEQLLGHLMLALYRCGRGAEAVQRYARTRELLVEELGSEPGAELQRLHGLILRGDAGLNLPPAARMAAPAQLPPDAADFTGRARVVTEMVARLVPSDRRVPIEIVAGPGGVGKTALAVHVAHRIRNRFPNGQLYFDLRGSGPAPVPPGDVLADFLHAFGVPPLAIPDDTDARARRLRTQLAVRPVLLVLDDADGEEQLRPLLPALGGSAVVVTSRRRLTALAGATRTELAAMPPDEALELLAAIVDASRIAAEPDFAAQIVRFCGYLPLAVRIAGARLAARPHWTLRMLAERLGDEQRRLAELRAGDLGVRASIAVGYDAITATERRAMDGLALVDAPDLAPWTVAALLGTSVRTAGDVVERLLDVRLLDPAGPDQLGQLRYRFHELVRLLAREGLDAMPRAERAGWLCGPLDVAAYLSHAATRKLLPDTFLRYRPPPRPAELEAEVEQRMADKPAEWLMAEHGTLAALARQAHAHRLWPSVWLLAEGLTYALESGIAMFSWRTVQDLALDAARQAGNRPIQAYLHDRSAYHLWMCGRWDEAEEHIADALAALEGLDEPHVRACVEHTRSFLLWERGHWEENLAVLRRCLPTFQRYGDVGREAAVLCQLGYAIDAYGRHEDALHHLEQSLALYRTYGNIHKQASVLIQLGVVHRRRGYPEQAARHFLDALHLLAEHGSPRVQAQALFQLATVRLAQGETGAAVAALESGSELVREFGDRQGESIMLYKLGAARIEQGRPDEALAALRPALAIARELDAAQWQARSLQEIGRALAARGEHRDARDAWHAALEIYQSLDMPEAQDVRRLLADAGQPASG